MFKDPDGRVIVETTTFKATGYKPVLDKLKANNSTFQRILGQYNSSSTAYKLTFGQDDNRVPGGAWAFTRYGYTANGAVATIDFLKSPDAEQNDLGRATLIIHEAIHAHLALQGKTTPKSDNTHKTWTTYYNLMEEAVKEYAADNNIDLSDSQFKELAIMNAGPGAKIYDDYINKLATDNGTSYDEEKTAFDGRMWDLIGKDAVLPTKTDTPEKEEGE
jgi:hypothetical protein